MTHIKFKWFLGMIMKIHILAKWLELLSTLQNLRNNVLLGLVLL